MSRMSPGTLIVGIFAILFGLVGAYAVRKHFQKPMAVAKREQQTYTVPLASTDLEKGRPLTMGDVSLMKLTRQQIQERNLPAEFMSSPRQVIGRTLRDSLEKGEAFLTSQFYPEGMGPSVAQRVKPGLRAVTVSVEGTYSEGGLIASGTFVDVIFRSEANSEQSIPETTVTLLEAVEVLAVGSDSIQGGRAVNRNSRSTQPALKSVTLAVSPNQVNALKIVENRGVLSLATRGPEGDEPLEASQPTTLHGLLGINQPNKPHTTEIYRGGSRQTLTFEGDKVVEESITGFPVPSTRTVRARGNNNRRVTANDSNNTANQTVERAN